MTPEERSLLQGFLSDLARTPLSGKDPEADAMIADAVRSNPNALYLLVQHALLSDQALHAAQAQIEQMRQIQPASPPPSFFPPPQPSGQPAWNGPGGGPVPSSPFSSNGGLGGFLRGAGMLAAGVAGGDFLAQGIENIFSPRY